MNKRKTQGDYEVGNKNIENQANITDEGKEMYPTGLMRRAMIHIDRAITDLKATHNKGIENGAIDKLLDVYDWLHVTADVLDQMEEIEQIGDEQK